MYLYFLVQFSYVYDFCDCCGSGVVPFSVSLCFVLSESCGSQSGCHRRCL